jgi:hypothetical protein
MGLGCYATRVEGFIKLVKSKDKAGLLFLNGS